MSPCPCCGFDAEKKKPQDLAAIIHLSGHQRRIFDVLARNFGRYVDSTRLCDSVYADDPDGGPEFAKASVSVAIWKMRPKLRAYGLVIDSKDGAACGGRRLRWASEDERAQG